MSKDWMRKSDDELAKIAQAGLQGQGAVIEAMRRLRESLENAADSSDKHAQSSEKYSNRMLWLTIVIGLLTLVQAFAAFEAIFKIGGPK